MPIKIITTEDGSHSLYDEELNETYHSTRGAIGESMHVFVNAGLDDWRSLHKKEEVDILEVGFGTGLNAFLTAQYAVEKEVQIEFYSLEPFPIAKDIYENLNYSSEEDGKLWNAIHDSHWDQRISIADFFHLTKSTCKLEDFETPKRFNIIYFDAFAPSKQPEIWSLENLKKCYYLLLPGGVLTTYCAQGQFKRNLEEAGFDIETLQGAMGKKEMVRAIKK